MADLHDEVVAALDQVPIINGVTVVTADGRVLAERDAALDGGHVVVVVDAPERVRESFRSVRRGNWWVVRRVGRGGSVRGCRRPAVLPLTALPY